MSKYRFTPASIAEAAAFWTTSPHATVFTHPDVLQHLSQKVDWWMAWKGKESMCLWPICMPTGQRVALPEFTYYVGPMWSPAAYGMPAHRWLAASTSVYGGFIEHFLRRYGTIEACLPVGLLDVRVFDWWNYRERSKPRFQISPRYTARVEQLQEKTDDCILAGFRELRRREIRRINTGKLPQLTNDWTAADLSSLYLEVFARQGVELAEPDIAQISCLANIVRRGYGEVVACKDPSGGRIIGAILLLYGNGIANMVINLVGDEWRKVGLGAWLVCNAIKAARSHGESCFDFNGANSPARGDDKHSYGAKSVLYFELQYLGLDTIASGLNAGY